MVVRRYPAWVIRFFFEAFWIRGQENIPAIGPVIFISNHPNGLVDPFFVLGFSRRQAFYLAKEPLFKIPLVATFVRGLGCIPVYRKRDVGSDVARNQESFSEAIRVLQRGDCVGIFPEGESHSRPEVGPFRSGLLRICALALPIRELRIVPMAIAYTDKSRFQSRALARFGDPVALPPSDCSSADLRHAINQMRDGLIRLCAETEAELAALAPSGRPGSVKATLRGLSFILHWPLNYAIRTLAARIAGAETDLVATYKYCGGTLFSLPYWVLLSWVFSTIVGKSGWLAFPGLPLLSMLSYCSDERK